MEELDPESLASQLRSPHGKHAKAVGDFMSKGNRSLYSLTFEQVSVSPIRTVLEVGCGNGWYIERFLSLGEDVAYYGLDMSQEMIQEAQERILALGKRQMARVQHADILDWETNARYDLIAGINLIYFFDEPQELVNRLAGLLSPGGQLLLGFRTAGSMGQLPFARFGFRLFEPTAVEELMKCSGLNSIHTRQESEELQMPMGNYTVTNAIVSGTMLKPATA